MNPNFSALALGVVTLVLIFKWPPSWSKYVPGPLVALVVGTLLSLVLAEVPVLGNIPTGFPEFILPAVSHETFAIILEAALAFVKLLADEQLAELQGGDSRAVTSEERTQ